MFLLSIEVVLFSNLLSSPKSLKSSSPPKKNKNQTNELVGWLKGSFMPSSHTSASSFLTKTLPFLFQTQAEPPEQKASQTASLMALSGTAQPVWTPRNYSALAQEGVMRNAVVYRCVRMIAEAAASVPLQLYEGEVLQETHPLLSLLEHPNALQTGTDLLEDWYGYLLTAGNSYLEAVRVDGTVRELHALRPDRMKVLAGADGWPQAYEYTVDGRTMRFDQEGQGAGGGVPILQMKLFHPDNDHYGLSPLEPAAYAVDIHNQAGHWNKALLDNSARPSGALVYRSETGQLTPDQFARLKEELEDSFQGSQNAGRPLLLEGGLDWKNIGYSPRDMDFIETKYTAAREIALAFGVPPMLLGIPGDNSFANYAEANRTFWRATILPLVTRTSKALSHWIGADSASSTGSKNNKITLRPDLNKIEALSGERDARWQRIAACDSLTINEKRAALGYPPLEDGDHL